MEKLVAVSEQEVLINFVLNTKCRANVRIISLCSTNSIAFKVQTSSPHKFLVNPPTGIVQPLSQTTLRIILKPQNQLPPTFPRSPSDRFLIKTALFKPTESLNSFFLTLPDGSTQNVKLKVAFVGPFLLKHAVSCGDISAVKDMLKRQKSIVAELPKQETEYLFRVATKLPNSEDMVGLLLQTGFKIDTRANPNNTSEYLKGWSELHVAVAFDRTEEVLSLLKMKKYDSLDCKDKEGKTPLHLAVSKGNIRCAKMLLESGANKDARGKDGRTALYIAAAKGDRQMAKMLIEMGADPTITDDRGRSCFDIARDKGQVSHL